MQKEDTSWLLAEGEVRFRSLRVFPTHNYNVRAVYVSYIQTAIN